MVASSQQGDNLVFYYLSTFEIWSDEMGGLQCECPYKKWYKCPGNMQQQNNKTSNKYIYIYIISYNDCTSKNSMGTCVQHAGVSTLQHMLRLTLPL